MILITVLRYQFPNLGLISGRITISRCKNVIIPNVDELIDVVLCMGAFACELNRYLRCPYLDKLELRQVFFGVGKRHLGKSTTSRTGAWAYRIPIENPGGMGKYQIWGLTGSAGLFLPTI